MNAVLKIPREFLFLAVICYPHKKQFFFFTVSYGGSISEDVALRDFSFMDL